MHLIKNPLALAIAPLILIGCVTVDSNPKPEAIANDQQRAESRIALGLGYLEQGNMVQAKENLELALQHSPRYYRAQLSLAHYYEQVGEDQIASRWYARSLREHPTNGSVLNNYGVFLCKQGEFKRADDFFNRAIKQPRYYLISTSYENAALCALKAQQTDKAIYYLQRTLDHDPNRVQSMLRLSQLEIETEQYQQARVRLLKFHQKYGVKQSSLRLLIELESKAGNQAIEQKYRVKLEEIGE
jgi:type IV pilus assembly protein PilF